MTDAGNLAGLRTRVRSTALAALASPTLLSFQRWIIAALLSDAFSTTDLEAYCADESLAHLSFDERKWRRRMELCLVAKEVELEASAAIQEVYAVRLFSFSCCRCRAVERLTRTTSAQALQNSSTADAPGLWRILEIPLELPALNVRLFLHLSDLSCY